jgi:alpha-L-fucosidase
MTTIPSYLSPVHRRLWLDSPRAANRAWFGEADFGLFIHYGLYSQLGRGEWAMQRTCAHSDTCPRGGSCFVAKAAFADYAE